MHSRAATLEAAWMLDPGADMQKEEAKLIIHMVQTLRQMYPLTSPSHRPDGGTWQWVFVSQDKDPQTVGEDHGDFFSHSSEPRNPKSRCWQACTLSTGLWGGSFVCLPGFWRLQASLGLQLHPLVSFSSSAFSSAGLCPHLFSQQHWSSELGPTQIQDNLFSRPF